MSIHSQHIENQSIMRSDWHFEVRFSPIMDSNPAQQIKILSSLCHIQATRLSYILLCVDDLMYKYSQALTYEKEIFTAGDLNCNVMKHSQEADALNDLCSSLNLTQLITSPTRETSEL